MSTSQDWADFEDIVIDNDDLQEALYRGSQPSSVTPEPSDQQSVISEVATSALLALIDGKLDKSTLLRIGRDVVKSGIVDVPALTQGKVNEQVTERILNHIEERIEQPRANEKVTFLSHS